MQVIKSFLLAKDKMKADPKQINRLLKTARGQIDGILRMVEDDQYCIDIVTQISASTAILQRASKEILRAHIDGCIRDTLTCESDIEKEIKIDELMKVLEKLTK